MLCFQTKSLIFPCFLLTCACPPQQECTNVSDSVFNNCQVFKKKPTGQESICNNLGMLERWRGRGNKGRIIRYKMSPSDRKSLLHDSKKEQRNACGVKRWQKSQFFLNPLQVWACCKLLSP